MMARSMSSQRVPKGLARVENDVHSTIDECIVALQHGTFVGEVDGLIEGAFGAQGLAHDAHVRIDEDKAALLHGACVNEVDGLTQNAFVA